MLNPDLDPRPGTLMTRISHISIQAQMMNALTKDYRTTKPRRSKKRFDQQPCGDKTIRSTSSRKPHPIQHSLNSLSPGPLHPSQMTRSLANPGTHRDQSTSPTHDALKQEPAQSITSPDRKQTYAKLIYTPDSFLSLEAPVAQDPSSRNRGWRTG